MDSLASAIMLMVEEGELSRSAIKIQRKTLRDASNPLEMQEVMFIKNFRLNKAAFTYVLSVLEEKAAPSCLRFLAEGGYQHGVGKDYDIPMAQSTFCCVLKDVLALLQTHICPHWINLNLSDDEKRQAKMDLPKNRVSWSSVVCGRDSY
ncbi:uncharacterized protein LOC118736485 [Rhagoletis pomonella]|uniref:uncharacterized protein LOC118736485 n=1 Tax=Rhagoletis pomonella TaxID=28610 RepID=UPI001780376B|nr:uncharacterized protein LOC118736485 [Rhagoletis pomonella]